MNDLTPTSDEAPSIEKSISERRNSKSRIVIPRNSIFFNSLSNPTTQATVRARRRSSRTSLPRLGFDRRLIRYENSYRLGPDQDHRLDITRLRRVATTTIESAIIGYNYEGTQGKQFSVALAELIRSQIKQLPFTRYKIVVQVVIGQKRGQDLRVTSRCMWDTQLDRHLTISKETKDAFVCVTMFLVYTE